MKKTNYLIVFFLVYFSLSVQSQFYAKEDSLFIKIVGDTVQVWNTDVWANCASKFNSSVIYLDSNRIVITECDTIGPIVRCMCYFDLQISLGGLASGQYTISVYRQELKKYFYPKDTTIFIGELTFSLENPLSLAHSIHLYQSECHSLDGQTFTAQNWYAEANAACMAMRDGAQLRSVYSDNVSPDGKSATWSYKFSWYDSLNKHLELLYFHNEPNGVFLDSISLQIDCCVTDITDEWFDSDSALSYAEASGGETFREGNPDYIISASLYQALVPYSYPCWSIIYISEEDSTQKFSLYFDARRNSSRQISFSPATDTLFLLGGCTTPELSFHLGSVGAAKVISLEPGFNTLIRRIDSLGNSVDVNNSYFLITYPDGEYEYEIWYHPKSYPPYDPVLVPFDSIFYFEQYYFEIELIVKLNGVPVDSLSQFFRTESGLDAKPDNIPTYEFDLSQNYPNPFNPSTKIRFVIPKSSFVTLKVYDVLGREVATLVNEEKPLGEHEVEYNGSELSSGIYFYILNAGGNRLSKKMCLIK